MASYKLNALMMSALANGSKVRGVAEGVEIQLNDQVERRNPVIAAVAPNFLSPRNLKEYVQNAAHYCQLAVDKGASLVCFPAYFGDQAVFCSPLSEGLLASFMEQWEQGFPQERYLAKLVRGTEGYAREIYFNTFSVLAQRFHIYISAGSLFTLDDGEVKNRAYLFDPEGRVILAQDKLFLSEWEKKAGVTAGKEVHIANTKLGGIMLSSADEIDYFEPFLIGQDKGAEIAVVMGLHTQKELLQSRIRSEQHKLYIVSPQYGTSSIEDLEISGGCMITVPRLMSENRDGIVTYQGKEEITTVVFRKDDLAGQFDQYNGDENPELVQHIRRKRNNGNLS